MRAISSLHNHQHRTVATPKVLNGVINRRGIIASKEMAKKVKAKKKQSLRKPADSTMQRIEGEGSPSDTDHLSPTALFVNLISSWLR